MAGENKNLDLKSLSLDVKTLAGFRTVYSAASVAFNSVIEGGLEEPWLTHFNRMKSDYDSALKELEPTEQVPAALEASHHLASFKNLLSCANSLCSMLGSHVHSMKLNSATALNSAVEAEITKRTAAGDLIPKAALDAKISEVVEKRIKDEGFVAKDMHVQLCSAAKETGITEGKAAIKADVEAKEAQRTLIETRKGVLATNGLPLPAKDLEKILGGTEENFTTAQTTAKTRREALKAKGLSLNSDHDLWKNVWNSEGDYKNFDLLVDQMLASSERHEALAGSTGKAAAPTAMLC